MRMTRHLGVLVAVGVGCAVVFGCGPDQGQASMSARQRQDAAMHDPFHYSPDMSRTDISGGGVGNFDKEGFGKDVNDLINP